MRITINPGTGPCEDATEEAAVFNVGTFVEEVERSVRNGDRWRPGSARDLRVLVTRTPDEDYGEGRYAFLLSASPDGPGCEVQMPGLPLETLRTAAMWQPRLYVDGASWYWGFAVGIARDRLDPLDEV